MRIPVHHFVRLLASLALATVAFATSSEIPPHGTAIALFDGRDLTNFDILLKEHGLNNDPDHVFRVENGVIHVSGKEFGYVITKQEFANYYLRAEFKWGEGTYAPRAGHARDSGILYHVQARRKFGRLPSSFRSSKAGPETFG